MKNNPAKENILEVSRVYFYQYGYNKTTTRMIAKRLGMSNVNLHNYYKSKRDILSELFRRFFDTMYDEYEKVENRKRVSALETVIIYIQSFYYFLSYSNQMFSLYTEGVEENVIVEIFFERHFHLYQKINEQEIKGKLSDHEIAYNCYVMFDAMTWSYARYHKKETTLQLPFLRDHHIQLLLKLFELKEEDHRETIQSAIIIAKKMDYKAIREFWIEPEVIR
ncbi:MAG TPA: hypothetical protein DHN33_01405 [Eubacteriaceae bacterium]|nr:hypothetical protein [Eubacteriaceae bacterium]